MNLRIIIYLLGHVLKIEAGLMLVPAVVAVIYRESEGFWFLGIAAVSAIIGWAMSRKKPHNTVFYLKEGCVTTSLAWIIMSLVGCLPFYLTGAIPSFTNALFETISGFTTTGASILAEVESLPMSCLFWRSFSHWIGGMGVLVFLLAIIPLSGGSHMNLMRAESPGPSVGKLVPKVRATARILYMIYFGMTVIQTIFLLAGGVSLIDSMMLAFGTAGTGGFGITNGGLADYSGYVQWVVAIFMLLFGVNFNAYYLILLKHVKQACKMEEVKAYWAIVFVSCVAIFVNIYDHTMTALTTLRHVVFQVATLITSTGFATYDFDTWPVPSKMILVLLMFVGACAGSTGGGIKVSRILILVKSMGRELNAYLHPKSVRTIKMDGKTIDQGAVSSVGVYFVTFMFVFSASVFLVSLEGKDLVTNFTAVLATLNNMGPGLALVGPTQNYSGFTIFSKYVLMFDMLAGRLELFPMLILFHPVLWKETYMRRGKHKIHK